MAEIKIKPGFKNFKIGFNNKYEEIGKRDDLHLLIRDAKANNDRSILDMFDSVPTEKEIKGRIAADLKAKHSKNEADEPADTNADDTADQHTGKGGSKAGRASAGENGD